MKMKEIVKVWGCSSVGQSATLALQKSWVRVPPSPHKIKVMIETAAQIFGTTFVAIILFCMVWTFGTYIAEDIKLKKNKQNEQLE